MDATPSRPSPRRRILEGAAILMVSRVVSLALGLVQFFLLARIFGTSRPADAFFIADPLQALFLGVAETTLNVAFMPSFVHLREGGDEEGAWTVASTLLKPGLIFFALFGIVLYACAAPISRMLAPGMDAATFALTVQIVRIMSPLPFITFAAAFFSTMEFIEERFMVPALTAILVAFGGPFALFFYAGQYGILALPVGMLAAGIVRVLILFATMRDKRRLFATPVSFRHPASRQLGAILGPRIFTVSLTQLNFMVDRFFASLLGPGFIAALTYAMKVNMTVVSLVLPPLGRALMPGFARMAAQGRHADLRATLTRIIALVGFILTPAFMMLCFFRHEVLALVFKSNASVADTAQAILYFSVGMLFYFLGPVLSATFFSMQDSRRPLYASMGAFAANVVLDFMLVKVLGFRGIALATSFVACVRVIILWQLLKHHLGRLDTRAIVASLGKSLAAAFAMAVFGRWLYGLLGVPLPGAVARLAATCVAAGGVYVVLQAMLNRAALQQLATMLRRRMGRRRN